jgi:hypothetical protein
MTLTHTIFKYTQCNFMMKQTAKCSIFQKLSNQMIINQCDSLVTYLICVVKRRNTMVSWAVPEGVGLYLTSIQLHCSLVGSG